MKWVRRIVAGLVGLPVFTVIVLLVLGQREGAGHVTARVAIARPPAQVFRNLADGKLVKKWLKAVSVEPLTEGGFRQGARWRVVVETRGERTAIETEVTAAETDRFVSFVLKNAAGAPVAFKELAEYRLEGRDGGTLLSASGDTHYDAFVLRLLEPLLTPRAQSELVETLSRLKSQVEADFPPPAPAR